VVFSQWLGKIIETVLADELVLLYPTADFQPRKPLFYESISSIFKPCRYSNFIAISPTLNKTLHFYTCQSLVRWRIVFLRSFDVATK